MTLWCVYQFRHTHVTNYPTTRFIAGFLLTTGLVYIHFPAFQSGVSYFALRTFGRGVTLSSVTTGLRSRS